jgi:TRAP-type mannitol/chloroaromatic compound transport system permease small subunit
MHFIKKFLLIVDAINEWCKNLFAYLTYALMAIVVYDVTLRYVFNRPTEWGLELNGFLLLAIAFLGGGYALKQDAHVRVTIIHEMFSARTRAAIDVFTYLVFFVVCVVLIRYGADVTWDSFRSKTTTPSTWAPALWPSQALIPIGAFLIGLQGLAKWIRDIHLMVKGVEINGDMGRE